MNGATETSAGYVCLPFLSYTKGRDSPVVEENSPAAGFESRTPCPNSRWLIAFPTAAVVHCGSAVLGLGTLCRFEHDQSHLRTASACHSVGSAGFEPRTPCLECMPNSTELQEF